MGVRRRMGVGVGFFKGRSLGCLVRCARFLSPFRFRFGFDGSMDGDRLVRVRTRRDLDASGRLFGLRVGDRAGFVDRFERLLRDDRPHIHYI